MRKILLLALPLVLLITLVGCTNQPSPTQSQSIVTQTISALQNASSYKLDTDVVNTYIATSAPEPNVLTTEWKGTKSVDLSNRCLEMTMDIHTTQYSDWSLETYYADGWQYLKATTPGLNRPGNPWDKYKISDSIWALGTQIPYYIELLKTASQTNLLGSENLNGIDCYILSVTPSVQSAIDWVVAQQQRVGPQVDVMFGGGIPVVRTDAYQNGSTKLWIAKDSYLPVKAQIEATFAGNVGGGSITTTPYTPTTGPVTSSFSGQAIFSNYNQPVTFQLPQEAINGQEH